MIKVMSMLSVVLLCLLLGNVASRDSLAWFNGNNDLRIGFKDNCNFVWRGDTGNTKNAEFRCGSAKGDPMLIKKVEDTNLYKIYSNDRQLVWRGDKGNTKNAEFRTGSYNDKFWILKQDNGHFAIGFTSSGGTLCPLVWRGDEGNTKNAEFRCGAPISDTFWIKGKGCGITKVKIHDNGKNAVYDGQAVVGVTTGGSCHKGTNQLQLSHSSTLEESFGIETSKTSELNWGFSVSVTLEASAKFLGSGGSVSFTAGASVGGSTSIGTSRSKSTSSSTTSGSSQTVTYKNPGGAMIIGFVNRYKFDKSSVPATYTVTCKNKHQFEYRSQIKLTSKFYSHTFYRDYKGEFINRKCTEDQLACIDNRRFLTYKDIRSAGEQFAECFPKGVGFIPKR